MEVINDELKSLVLKDLEIIKKIDTIGVLNPFIINIRKKLDNILDVNEADDQLKIIYNEMYKYYPYIIIKSPFYKFFNMPQYKRTFPRATIQHYKTLFRIQKHALQVIVGNLEKQIQIFKQDFTRWPLF